MKTKLPLFISLAVSAAVLTGCTLSATNTNGNTNSNVNAAANTNTATNENTNVAETNTNTTVHSDWKTYANTEYGFSLQYPNDWGTPRPTNPDNAPLLLTINFQNTTNLQQDISGNPRIVVSDNRTENVTSSDANNWFNYSKIDFTKSEDELAQSLRRNTTESMEVKKITINNINALEVTEITSDLDGKKITTFHVLIPNYNGKQYNLTISGDISIQSTLLEVSNTISF